MLCVNPQAYDRVCGPTSGGIARIWLFDGEDFNLTQAAAVNGVAQPYAAIALRAGATAASGAKMFPVKFEKDEAEYTFKQSRKGCSVKYEHQLEFKLPDLSQLITTWNASLDSAGCCCGVGLAIQLNSGKIFIAGEKYVNAEVIDIPLTLKQDGSSGTSGKLLDDFNGETVIIKGDAGRKLYEFTGGVQAIVDLQ